MAYMIILYYILLSAAYVDDFEITSSITLYWTLNKNMKI